MQLSGNKKDKKHGKRKTLSGQRASQSQFDGHSSTLSKGDKTPRDDTKKFKEEGNLAVHGYDDDGNQFDIQHLNTEYLPKFYHDAPRIKYNGRR